MPSETFNFTGGWQRFTVPEGVDTIHVDVKGAGSGIREGGRVRGNLGVHEGQQLWIQVGREGRAHSGMSGGGDAWGGGGPGGDARGGRDGGNGGGGASAIRLGNFDGAIKAVAGGAGGNSGDSGAGGQGGDSTGQSGARGGAGGGATTQATGGTQSRGGEGGTSSRGGWYTGQDAPNTRLGQGGSGASPNRTSADGGGGGGGGYYPGGGGQGSAPGFTPGGGGGGGSNYSDPLSSVDSSRGGGGTGNGQVVLQWTPTINPNTLPPPPSNLTVEGQPMGSETPSRAGELADIGFDLAVSPDVLVHGVLRYSAYPDFSNAITLPTRDGPPGRTEQIYINVRPGTLYHVRVWTQDQNGNFSNTYTAGSFWTNRPPVAPVLVSPSDNSQFSPLDNITFTWDPTDPDDPDSESGWTFRWRKIPKPGHAQTPWIREVTGLDARTSITLDAGTFVGNTFYEWQVRTRDGRGVWGDWAHTKSFYILADSTPPTLLYPARGAAIVAGETQVFSWQFLDPSADAVQVRADIQYRIVGTQEWIVRFGDPDPGQPGGAPQWVIPAGTFVPGYHYEWQARTENEGLFVSEWSTTEDFWAIETPGTGVVQVVGNEDRTIQPPLGCGVNRVFIYDRGGLVMRGEITPLETLQYGRKRDDISTCLITTNGFGTDCGQLLSSLRCWQHEIVVFRDGKRVWEGPVARITDGVNGFEIEAKDVMNYVYRRVMRQGYNDTFRSVNGVDVGGLSVVRRAALITMNALAYDDPNVLKWMTMLNFSDDARQHRAVPDWSKTCWEEIDDMAASAGLDYTVSGRRIIYWDTHRPVGRLPEMRDGDFSEPPRITEYGMQLANVFGVTNGSGIYGVAERGIVDVPPEQGQQGLLRVPLYFGWVEQLASAYGETVGAEPDTLTAQARASLEATLASQADRNISGRWPTPVVVRVPDNAYLSPDVAIGFDQLIPGVWIPVRAKGKVREIAQWQKLDSVTVTQSGSEGEKVAIVMSPAPNFGFDPDAEAAATEEA